MKIALVCDSPLLKKSLQLYFKESMSDYDACDFVISDKKVKSNKPVLFIGKQKDASLKVPFSKEQLLSKAQQFYQNHASEDAQVLERELAKLNKKHKEKLERIIKEFHAKG